MQVCCIVPLRSDVGLIELKGAAYLMSSPMVALVVRELVMLMYNQRLNERGAVSWDSDYLHSLSFFSPEKKNFHPLRTKRSLSRNPKNRRTRKDPSERVPRSPG